MKYYRQNNGLHICISALEMTACLLIATLVPFLLKGSMEEAHVMPWIAVGVGGMFFAIGIIVSAVGVLFSDEVVGMDDFHFSLNGEERDLREVESIFFSPGTVGKRHWRRPYLLVILSDGEEYLFTAPALRFVLRMKLACPQARFKIGDLWLWILMPVVGIIMGLVITYGN